HHYFTCLLPETYYNVGPCHCLRARVLLAQPSHRESGEQQPKITQRNIEISGDQQQVDYDYHQPGCDNVSEDSRFKPDSNSSYNLDDADNKHQRVRLYGEALATTPGRYWSQLTKRWKNLSNPARMGATVNPT